MLAQVHKQVYDNLIRMDCQGDKDRSLGESKDALQGIRYMQVLG